MLVLFIVFTIEYHKPEPWNQEMTLCTTEGEVINLTFQLELYKFFFKPTEIRGSIVYKGERYISTYELYTRQKQGFLANIEQKLKGKIIAGDFWRKVKFEDLMKKTITLYGFDKKGSKICIAIYDNSEVYICYGSAKTSKEAEILEEYFWGDFLWIDFPGNVKIK